MNLMGIRSKRRFLDRLGDLSNGALRLHTPDGEIHEFGRGHPFGDMQLHDWSALTPNSLSKTYAAGLWSSSSLPRLSTLFVSNPKIFGSNKSLEPLSAIGNAEPGNEFFQLLLDPGMNHTSALFGDGIADLEQAQQEKYDHILNQLTPGFRLLDVNCGWGGLAERATERGFFVTGLTHSAAQKGYADARLDGLADIRRQKLSAEADTYDNIVAIETLNRISPRMRLSFFSDLKLRLAQNGRIIMQAVITPETNSVQRPDVPTTSLLLNLIDQSGLRVQESFDFGTSYATTFRLWHEQMKKNYHRLVHMGYDDVYQREWQFALNTTAALFETGQTNVMQLELAHKL